MNKTIWAIAFVVLACGISFAIGNATATPIDQNKFTGNGTAGNITTEGGNITEMDIGTNISTEKWAGMYGNLTGQLVLSEAANTAYMYSWTYDPAAGGTVCASTGSNFAWSQVATTTGAIIDGIWGFGTAADNATETLDDVGGGTVTINTVAEASAAAVTTEGATTWQTVAFQNTAGAAKSDFVFCVNVTSDGTAFNSKTVDFQLIAPTNDAAATYEQYFFFVELS